MKQKYELLMLDLNFRVINAEGIFARARDITAEAALGRIVSYVLANFKTHLIYLIVL